MPARKADCLATSNASSKYEFSISYTVRSNFIFTEQFSKALDMMNRAVSGHFQPGVKENIAYFTLTERRNIADAPGSRSNSPASSIPSTAPFEVNYFTWHRHSYNHAATHLHNENWIYLEEFSSCRTRVVFISQMTSLKG